MAENITIVDFSKTMELRFKNSKMPMMVSVLIQAITHIEELCNNDLRKIAILLQKAKRRIVTFVKNRNLYDTDERLQNAWKELKQHRCWYNNMLSNHCELSEIIFTKNFNLI